MVIFEDIDDVAEWLKPLNYIEFWEAVAPYDLVLQDRDHCDGLIASGEVEQALILRVLKMMARIELTEIFDLEWRIYEPPIAQYVTSTH